MQSLLLWVGRDGPRGLGGQDFLISLNPSGVVKPSDGQCPHFALCKAQGDVIAWTKIHPGALLWALLMASCGFTLEANMPRQHRVPTHLAPVLVGSAGTMVAPKPSSQCTALLLQEHPQPHGGIPAVLWWLQVPVPGGSVPQEQQSSRMATAP